MRIDIKTLKRTAPKDRDIRAMYIINAGFETCTERMKEATLRFFADRMGYTITRKVDQCPAR